MGKTFRTIRAKIAISFAFLLIISIAIGIFAMRKVDQVAYISEDISHQLQGITVLGELGTLSQQLRGLAALQHFSTQTEERRSYAIEAEKARQSFSQAWSRYAAMVEEGTESELADRLRLAWQHFLAIQEEVAAFDNASLSPLATTIVQTDLRHDAAKFYDAVVAVQAFRQTAATTATSAAVQIRSSVRWWLIVALGVLSSFCLLVGGYLMVDISMPVRRMTDVMRRLADRDFDAVVPDVRRKDEIGAMAGSVQVFKDNLIRTMVLEEETAQARASAEEQRRAAMRQMAEIFEGAVGGIVGMVSSSATELQATAQTMTATAIQTANQCTIVATAAEEASSNVNTVAAAAEQLGASVHEIGRQVAGSSDLARLAVSEAGRTTDLVHEMTTSVTQIGQVVQMISRIASQTNLLALNATIEAARAGQAGRGFAVVAAEVKQLAEQTTRATEEIGRQIGQVQGSTGQAAGAIELISGRIREISAVTTSIAAAVEQQGAATSEIVRNVSQAASGASAVTSNIAGVAGAAEETGAAASQVLSSASELSRQSEHLTSEVHRFLSTIRAA